jgi:hypothetical protein
MHYLNVRILLICLISAVTFQSCETEIDITAPYKQIPVIYGLLDLTADTQFVMINRTYLGSGNALDYATVEDSMLFINVDARLYYGSAETDYVQLDSIRVTEKDLDGIFYAPSQRVYFVPTANFPSNIWNSTTEFRLVITADGQEINAKTKLVDVSDQHLNDLRPFFNPSQAVSFALLSQGQIGYVSSFKFEWRAFENAIKHQSYILFDYSEVRSDGSRVNKTLRIPYAVSDAPSGNHIFNSFSKSGDFFYRYIEAHIVADAEVLKREFGGLHFVIDAAGTDFSTYLNVGSPVSSVGQERPRYSNVNNGEGIGVFSSRGHFSYDKFLKISGTTPPTITELATGQYTAQFCFCDPEPGSTFDCNTIICQ